MAILDFTIAMQANVGISRLARFFPTIRRRLSALVQMCGTWRSLAGECRHRRRSRMVAHAGLSQRSKHLRKRRLDL